MNYSSLENKKTESWGGTSGRRMGLMAAHEKGEREKERARDTHAEKRAIGKKRHSGAW